MSPLVPGHPKPGPARDAMPCHAAHSVRHTSTCCLQPSASAPQPRQVHACSTHTGGAPRYPLHAFSHASPCRLPRRRREPAPAQQGTGRRCTPRSVGHGAGVHQLCRATGHRPPCAPKGVAGGAGVHQLCRATGHRPPCAPKGVAGGAGVHQLCRATGHRPPCAPKGVAGGAGVHQLCRATGHRPPCAPKGVAGGAGVHQLCRATGRRPQVHAKRPATAPWAFTLQTFPQKKNTSSHLMHQLQRTHCPWWTPAPSTPAAAAPRPSTIHQLPPTATHAVFHCLRCSSDAPADARQMLFVSKAIHRPSMPCCSIRRAWGEGGHSSEGDWAQHRGRRGGTLFWARAGMSPLSAALNSVLLNQAGLWGRERKGAQGAGRGNVRHRGH